MTSAQLEHAQKRMQQKWYELVMAEQRGTSMQVLERMYSSYVLAMEEYNRCSAEYQKECQAESGPIPVNQKKTATSKPSSQDTGHEKLAS
jgi:hypothetical protein